MEADLICRVLINDPSLFRRYCPSDTYTTVFNNISPLINIPSEMSFISQSNARFYYPNSWEELLKIMIMRMVMSGHLMMTPSPALNYFPIWWLFYPLSPIQDLFITLSVVIIIIVIMMLINPPLIPLSSTSLLQMMFLLFLYVNFLLKTTTTGPVIHLCQTHAKIENKEW